MQWNAAPVLFHCFDIWVETLFKNELRTRYVQGLPPNSAVTALTIMNMFFMGTYAWRAGASKAAATSRKRAFKLFPPWKRKLLLTFSDHMLTSRMPNNGQLDIAFFLYKCVQCTLFKAVFLCLPINVRMNKKSCLNGYLMQYVSL